VKFKYENRPKVCKILSITPIYDYENVAYFDDYINYPKKCSIYDIKPYLFPLSSMTEEQYNEFFSYYHNMEMTEVKASGDYLKAAYIGDDAKYRWLNKNHFDYRGLIEKELAIDATNLNIY
jgi:Fe-S-cluster containining protein